MTVDTLDVARLEDDGTAGPELQVTFGHVGPMCVLTLRGTLHSQSVHVLEAEFDQLGRTACRRVVVDATELIGIDDTGRRVLTGLAHYVRGRGGILRVIGETNPIARGLASELAHG